jgi:hypothetical protein
MAKLTRITLGSIDNLVDNSEVVAVGKGTIKGSRWRSQYLKLTTPKEKRKIKTHMIIMNSSQDDFLAYVNEFLSNKNLYFTNIEYRADKYYGFFPHQLSGKLYKEKTE